MRTAAAAGPAALHSPGETGSASVLVVAVVAVVVWLVGVSMTLAAVGARRQRVAAAADLAAVAGAVTWPAPVTRMCARAATVARLNGARIADCRARGAVVDVTVWLVARPGEPLSGGRVIGRARATRAGRAPP